MTLVAKSWRLAMHPTHRDEGATMLRRIVTMVAALLVTLAMSASPTNAGQDSYGALQVVDSQHSVSYLPTPQPECTSIRDVAWPPIVPPILGIVNNTSYYVEFFFADGCTGPSFLVSAGTSESNPGWGLGDPTSYWTL